MLAPGGVLRAAFLETNPVQARRDARGEWQGPAPDLVRELARRHRLQYQLLPQPDAGSVIARVRAGQADIGFLAYEAARATQVDFSAPYAMMANSYLVRADSPIRRSADVDRPGIKVAAVKGQSQQLFVSENLTQAAVVVLPTVPPNEQIVAMLEKGEVHAFAANRQRMQEAARTSAQVRVLDDTFFLIGQAIVVNKGEAAKLAEVNRFVADVLATGMVRRSIDDAGLTGNVQLPR